LTEEEFMKYLDEKGEEVAWNDKRNKSNNMGYWRGYLFS
jgi:hypothetical protein